MININLANIVGTSTSMKSDCISSGDLLKSLDFLSEFKLELENNGDISKNTEDVDNELILYNLICELYQKFNNQENISDLIPKSDINLEESNNSVLQLDENLLVSKDLKQTLENISDYIEKNSSDIAPELITDAKIIIDKIKNHIEKTKKISNETTYDNLDTIATLRMSNFDKVSKNDNKDIEYLEKIVSPKDNDYTNSLTSLNNFTSIYNNTNVSIEGSSIEQPVTAIRQEFVSEDIVKSVKYMKTVDVEELNVKFNPRDLGEININISKADDQSNLFITVDNDSVLDLVNNNLDDIKNHLKDTNINVREIVITIKPSEESLFSDNLNQGFNQQGSFKQNKNSKYKTDNQEITDEVLTNDYEDENLNILI